jgi:hypothetical protein
VLVTRDRFAERSHLQWFENLTGQVRRIVWYLGGMRSIPEAEILRTLPLRTDGAGGEKASGKQRLELDRRGSFVRAYRERGGVDGNGHRLDPVLAFHLGLTEER